LPMSILQMYKQTFVEIVLEHAYQEARMTHRSPAGSSDKGSV
jgi:hypothetical protein